MEVAMRELYGALLARPSKALGGLEVQGMVDFVYRRVPKLRVVLRCIIRSWDSGFHCVVWQEQSRFTGMRPTPYTWGPSKEYIQGSKMRAKWVLASNDIT